MSYANDFNKLVGLKRLSEWKLEGADPIRAAFDALLSKHLAADVKMNKKDGYVPSKGVLAQREFSRQADEVAEIGKSVRGDFWSEWAGKSKVQVGFRDNRDKEQYRVAVEKLDDALNAKAYTLMNHGGGVQSVILRVRVADKVDELRPEWLKAMKKAGADVKEGKLPEVDEAFVAAFAGKREAEGRPLSFESWNATMKAALERNLGEGEGEALTYNKFDLTKVSAVLAPFSNLSFIPAREFGPVLYIDGPAETLGALAKSAEKRLGTFEALMTSKSRLRLAWD